MKKTFTYIVKYGTIAYKNNKKVITNESKFNLFFKSNLYQTF